ncbi:MAG: hypothetical protein K6A65_00220 [Succinivibrionaceae bacterium]|nr:hypothetical protein [Succinivibrionaceae bacterium]
MSSQARRRHVREERERINREWAQERRLKREALLSDPTSDVAHRIFVSCALVEGLGGGYAPDFGFFNEAYWSQGYWRQCQERAREMEREYLQDGTLPQAFWFIEPVDAVRDEGQLEYNCRYRKVGLP